MNVARRYGDNDAWLLALGCLLLMVTIVVLIGAILLGYYFAAHDGI